MWINLNNIGIDAREVVAVQVVNDDYQCFNGQTTPIGLSQIFLKDGREIKGVLQNEAMEVKALVSKYDWEKVSFQAIPPPTPEEIEKASKTP